MTCVSCDELVDLGRAWPQLVAAASAARCRRSTCARVLITASGVRSSWHASATNWRCSSMACTERPHRAAAGEQTRRRGEQHAERRPPRPST